MIQMKLYTKQKKITDIENKLMVTKREREVWNKLGIWD